MKRLILTTLVLCLAAGILLAEMSVTVDAKTQRYTIQDSGKPVLTYNFGTVPVPQPLKGKKYAEPRSDYVHPLYGPDGEVLTMDYSPDHPHHRGIYWAWPEVTYKGEMRDIHALQGVFARPVKLHKNEAGKESAVISAENVWKWSDKEEIVREFATITAYPAKDGLRIIDFAFKFEALQDGITLARRVQKNYGGFNIRMSHFKDIKIVKHSDTPGAYPCTAWAELTGTPPDGEEPVGIFLLQSPANPLYPGDWVEYANLPWLQPTFPAAGMAYALKKGQALELAYRVIVRSGAGLKTAPEKLFTAYAGRLPDPLAKMATYQYGQSRTVMTETEQAIRNAPGKEPAAFEKRILAVLGSGKTSADFQRWAFRQLQICGSEKCVPVAATYLDKDSWMQALDAVVAVPGDYSAKTLLGTLRALPAEKSAAVIQAIGMRRDEEAISVLAKYAAGDQALTAGSALDALARIGTAESAKTLSSLKVNSKLASALLDAKLLCAETLLDSTPGGAAASPPSDLSAATTLFNGVWKNTSSTSAQRTAALIGLTRCSKIEAAEIISALSSDDPQIRHGAAAALSTLDAKKLSQLQSNFTDLPDASKLIVMGAWSRKDVREAEVSMITQLENPNPDVQITAIRALRTTGGGASVTPLMKIAAAGGGAGSEAKITLAQLSGKEVFPALVAETKSSDPKISKAAVKLLSERRDPGYLELMMKTAQSKDEQAAASALAALRSSGTAKEIPALRKLLFEIDGSLKPTVAGTIAGIANRDPDGADIAAFLNSTPKITGEARNAMVSALPEIGGAEALAFVSTAQDETAIRALFNWPDSSAVKPLQAIVANKTLDEKLNKLACAGLLRLVKNTVPTTGQGRELKAALPHVRDQGIKKQISDYLSDLNKVNIAKGKPIKASHPHQAAAKPELAVDGNIATFWSCAHSPTTVAVDLGAEEAISSIKVVNYFRDKRYYQYTVEISTDGKTWKQIADMSKNTAPATEVGTTHKFASTPARYVRVTMLKNSANPGMHIVELEVYGKAE